MTVRGQEAVVIGTTLQAIADEFEAWLAAGMRKSSLLDWTPEKAMAYLEVA
jgi:hypothetical protein